MLQKDIISFLLLLCFGGAYISKLILLKRHDKINANVLAKGAKDKTVKSVEGFVSATSMIWLLVWLAEILFNEFIKSVIGSLFSGTASDYTGLFITALGAAAFIAAVVYMKTSWRVGIDKASKTSLVTGGIYKFSRNPAFVGFNLMIAGVFIMYANILTLLVMAVNMLAFHLLILQEEKHLQEMFGEEYKAYKQKVPRYFLFIR